MKDLFFSSVQSDAGHPDEQEVDGQGGHEHLDPAGNSRRVSAACFGRAAASRDGLMMYRNRSCIGYTFLYQNATSKVGVLPIHETVIFFGSTF